MLGAGPRPEKAIQRGGAPDGWVDPTFLDIEPLPGYVVHDLDTFPYPFGDGAFDEIHAYEVLEHCGSLGDWRFFFAQFNELGRILVDGGSLYATVPALGSVWLFGDPGHRRVITGDMLQFLDQDFYGCGKTQSDGYRAFLDWSWKVEYLQVLGDRLAFVLRKESLH